jgi:hydroxyethylthiazole kinase-like uncharacterized protein yjeF
LRKLQSHGAALRDRFVPRSATPEEMSYIDENCVALGVPVQSLMENAGARVAEVVDREYCVEGKKVVIAAGMGNKGGDGFVACRHLLNRGARVVLVLLGDKSGIRSPEARSNWRVLERLGTGLTLLSVRDSAEVHLLGSELSDADVVVDAMLGTGGRGPLREPIASAVRKLNDSRKPIVSIDIPTGLDTGEAQKLRVRAEHTVTMHKPKTGLLRARLAGKVHVVDIGIPLEAELFSGPGDVRRVVEPRKAFSSKRDNGYILIVGGSELYSGAPGLTALSALRTGAGLCFVAAPDEACRNIRSFSPDLIVDPLPGRFFAPEHLKHVTGKLLTRVDSVVIGPGIGSRDETMAAVKSLVVAVKKLGMPLILDADAIRSFAGRPDLIGYARAVLTPNAGEFKAVASVEVKGGWKERFEPSVALAKRAGCTILLKGHDTVTTDGARLKVNVTGSPSLATGGTGDVLSGIIATFLAQGKEPFSAAVAGAYIHGRAGELAFDDKGFHILASDLIDELPAVLRPFDRQG